MLLKTGPPPNIYGADVLELKKLVKQSHNLQNEFNKAFAKLQEMISAQIGQAQITVKKRQSLFNAMNIFDGLSSKMFFIEFLDCNECVYRILCKASEFSCLKMIFYIAVIILSIYLIEL